LFCGDAFFSKHILDKYKLPFMIDEDNTLKSLRYLREDNYQIYIPSHGEATDDIKTVVDLNINKIEKIENDIKSLLKKENTTEELLQGVFNKYNINISSTQQYCLLKTTTMAYLSSLTNREVVKTGIKNNVLSWCLN
ncbi:MAG: MBL fold metallo-hydrolase, partial [bacterium]